MNQLTPQDLAHLRAKVSELDADGNFKNEHGNPNNCILKLLAHIDAQAESVVSLEDRFRSDQGIIKERGDALIAAIDRAEKAEWPLLAKNQPCGCVVCTCENEDQCQGCGSRHCGQHPVGEFENPIYKPHPLLAKVAELQAIVDRLQGDDRMKRFDLNLPSQFVPHTAEENAAMEAALAAKGDGK